ncbi:MAG: hypothetical protein MJA82_11930 [Clostridia bacterium]|nr:hypothetical protein [Clostridia bacterium]
MLDREENLKLISLEIKRLKLLKKIKSLKNTMVELREIEEELKEKLNRIEVLEEITLEEILRQIHLLKEIDMDIGVLKINKIEAPIKKLMESKLNSLLPFQNITNRLNK